MRQFILFLFCLGWMMALKAQTEPTMPNINHLFQVKELSCTWSSTDECWDRNISALNDGNTSSNPLTSWSGEEGQVTIVFEHMRYIEGIKVWQNQQDDGFDIYNIGHHDYPANGRFIPVDKALCSITFNIYAVNDVELYEIEVFGDNTPATFVEYTFEYDLAGNRTSRVYDIKLNELTEGSCGYDNAKTAKDIEQWQSYPDYLDNINLKLYPNPTMGELVIEVINAGDKNPKLTYELIDAQGRRMWREKRKDNYFLLDMTNMVSGNYVLRLSLNNEVKTYKIIKK